MALTKLNNNGIAGVTALPSSIALGDMVLVSSATASGSANITFTLADYKEYQFYFVNIHPATDQAKFTIGFRDGGTDFDAVKTTTVFEAYNFESGSPVGLGYNTGEDIAQGTGFQTLANLVGNGNDDNCNGIIKLFDPSSDTFVKHFISQTSQSYRAGAPAEINWFVAGYCNTQTAINGVQFKMSSGNIDAGTILMYGIN